MVAPSATTSWLGSRDNRILGALSLREKVSWKEEYAWTLLEGKLGSSIWPTFRRGFLCLEWAETEDRIRLVMATKPAKNFMVRQLFFSLLRDRVVPSQRCHTGPVGCGGSCLWRIGVLVGGGGVAGIQKTGWHRERRTWTLGGRKFAEEDSAQEIEFLEEGS